MAVLTGILLGLSTLLFIGPVFFYLLKSTLEYNVKAGIAVAVGIIVGDVICVVLALKGVGIFFGNADNNKLLALLGGLLLLIMGLKYLFKPSIENVSNLSNPKSLWRYGINGFLINFVNPFVFAVWIGFLSINQSQFESKASVVTSLVFTLLIIFLTDCLKALFAHKLKQFINPIRLKIVFKIFGVIMILFSVRLIWMVL
jgi:threonine/homoserine/homoserine lactone efflux protein